MTRFSKLTLDGHGKLVESEVRDIEQSQMLACPHCIMMAEHYDASGKCRCDDPAHDEMHEWGYVWTGKRWDIPPDEAVEYDEHN